MKKLIFILFSTAALANIGPFPGSGGGGGASITSINADTTAAQLLSVGTSGTNFVITDAGGGSHVFNLPIASASNTGKLSSADWSTFNGKQASGSYITALTGDVAASGPGSVAATLTTVNSNVGSFGSSTSIPSFTVNGKGLITAASGNVVIAPAGTLSGATLAAGVTASSLTSVGTIATGVWNGTTIAIANGGTGATAKAAAFDALQPMSASGDIIYGGTSGTGTRLAKGSDTQVLTLASGLPTWATPAAAGVTTLAAIGASPNANAATISGSTLNLQPANASFGGVVTTAAQTFSGTKTFSDTNLYLNGTAASDAIRFEVNNAGNGLRIQVDGTTGLGTQAMAVIFTADNNNVQFLSSTKYDALELGGISAPNTSRTNGTIGLDLRQRKAITGIGGTTTVNGSTSIVGSATEFLMQFGVGDLVSVSSAASTYATITAIADNTHMTVSTALGNGTSQTLNKKPAALRISLNDDSEAVLVDNSGNVKFDKAINSAVAQTVINGSVSGSITCSQPFQGTSYKKVVCYLAAYNDVSTVYTYPTAFTQTPYAFGATAAVSGATVSATTLSFVVSGTTGFLFLEGY